MTKEQFSEIVGTLLGYTDSDIRVHQQDIFFAGDAFRGQAIAEYLRIYGENSIGAFCTTLYLDVQTDSIKGLKYIDLETQFLGLSNSSGVANIALPQDFSDSIVLTPVNMQSAFSALEAGNALGKSQGFREGNKIYLTRILAGQNKIAVTSVPSLFKSLGERDEIPQPLEFNKMLIDGTRAMFEEQKYMTKDNVNDMHPEQPTK